MQAANFQEIVDDIVRRDARYRPEAYHFVREALDLTQRAVHKGKETRTGRDPANRHVTGQQLLEGIRQHALQAYGPMAFHVLNEWGIHRAGDFGEIVFNLVEFGRGMFGKTEKDSRADFEGGYDFEEAFRAPFQPSHKAPGSPQSLRGS